MKASKPLLQYWAFLSTSAFEIKVGHSGCRKVQQTGVNPHLFLSKIPLLRTTRPQSRTVVHDYQPSVLPIFQRFSWTYSDLKRCLQRRLDLLSSFLPIVDTMWIQDSILPVLLLFPPFLAAQTQCYLPDGSKAGSQYQPCNSVPNASSMCCDTSAGDQCQPNGLCKGFPDNTPQLWRDSCTDQSWRSPFCLQLCVNGVGSIKAGQALLFSLRISEALLTWRW